MLRDGDGIPVDKLGAARYFKKAALQGHPDAQYCCSIMYRGEDGIPENKTMEKFFLMQAVLQGHIEAQLELSRRFAVEAGTANQAKVKQYLERAAGHGSAEAKRLLS
jgi:TPR repeat protein